MRSIGIDVGGTKTAVALVNASNGAVLRLVRLETRASEGARQLGVRLGPALEEMVSDGEQLPVGIAVPELVSPSGEVLTDVVVPGLRGRPAGVLGVPTACVIDSDVRAAALAEARCGAGKGLSSFAYVSIGTGIAHTFVRDGVPWSGAHGAAILIGSGVLVDPRVDTGGVPIALEEWASGPGLVARAAAHDRPVDRGHDVLDLALRGDHEAQAAAWESGRAAGLAIAALVNLLDPHSVVVGGGLGSVDGPYWDALLAGAEEGRWPASPFDVPVVHATTGEIAGAIGAAIMAWEASSA
jgi:glucokinase